MAANRKPRKVAHARGATKVVPIDEALTTHKKERQEVFLAREVMGRARVARTATMPAEDPVSLGYRHLR